MEHVSLVILICVVVSFLTVSLMAWVARIRRNRARRKFHDMLGAYVGLRRRAKESDDAYRTRLRQEVSEPLRAIGTANVPLDLRTPENKPTWLTDEEWMGKKRHRFEP